jgi:hypothetical protein
LRSWREMQLKNFLAETQSHKEDYRQ